MSFFKNHRCHRCGKLLLRWRDRRYGGYIVKYKNGKRKELRYCASCGHKITAVEINSMKKIFGEINMAKVVENLRR